VRAHQGGGGERLTNVHVLLFAPGPGTATRVPVLACSDALKRGASVEIVPLDADSEVDAALARAAEPGTRIVVAGGDGQLRAVLRRMVRRVLPRAGQRPEDLPDDRTVPDLAPVGVLPLDASGAGDLASRLALPRSPAEVAAAVLGGGIRRVDLLRNDGGSLTVHGALIGAADEAGRPLGWQARIDVDNKMLSDGAEPLIACAIANAGGFAQLGEIPLVSAADPADGVLDVGIALPDGAGIEVRRARGRAVSVALVSAEVPFTDDTVDGVLTRKRTWWMERAAWAVYTG
jgi:hypothetical protein